MREGTNLRASELNSFEVPDVLEAAFTICYFISGSRTKSLLISVESCSGTNSGFSLLTNRQ